MGLRACPRLSPDRCPVACEPVAGIVVMPSSQEPWEGLMKLVHVSCLVLMATSVARAQVCRPPTGVAGALSLHGINVPIRIFGGGIFVPVVLNDGRTYNWLLDTGFEESVVDPTTAKQLHLKSVDERTESGPGGAVATARVHGVTRRVAGIPLGAATLASLDLSGFDPVFGHHLDGVLGYDFFRRFVVIIDYRSATLTLCDTASYRPGREEPIALHLESKQPYIDAQIEGKRGPPVRGALEIDTGKLDPFSVNAAFARKNGLLKSQSTLLAMRGINVGGVTQAWMTRVKSLEFGHLVVGNPLMGIAEENADRAGQIGYGILRRVRLTLDYSRATAYVSPSANFQLPYQFDHAGFVLGSRAPDFTRLVVLMVVAHTPAAVAGIRAGDEILRINGRRASDFTLQDARDLFESAAGQQHLVLRRGSAVINAVVTCRPLV